MASSTLFLIGELNEVSFMIDTDLKVHCNNESVKFKIQELVNKKLSTLTPDLDRYFCVGDFLTNRKNAPIIVKKFILYKRSCNNLVQVEYINSFIEKIPLPFIEGKYEEFDFSIDTQFNVKVSATEKYSKIEEHIDFVKCLITHEIKWAQSNPGLNYYPDPFSLTFNGLIKSEKLKLKKVYFYENPNRYQDVPPGVFY